MTSYNHIHVKLIFTQIKDIQLKLVHSNELIIDTIFERLTDRQAFY